MGYLSGPLPVPVKPSCRFLTSTWLAAASRAVPKIPGLIIACAISGCYAGAIEEMITVGKPLFRTAAAVLLFSLALTPAFAVTLKKPGDRKTAPAFELKNAEGQSVKLSDYKGKIVLIDFWATWCLPCKAAIPWMNELASKYKAEGLEVLGISMDDQGWEVVRPFIQEMGVKYPIVMGNKQVGDLYGEIDTLPVAFFIDRDQKVAAIHLGEASRNQFETALQTLLKTK